jgi:hypothetical protein
MTRSGFRQDKRPRGNGVAAAPVPLRGGWSIKNADKIRTHGGFADRDYGRRRRRNGNEVIDALMKDLHGRFSGEDAKHWPVRLDRRRNYEHTPVSETVLEPVY